MRTISEYYCPKCNEIVNDTLFFIEEKWVCEECAQEYFDDMQKHNNASYLLEYDFSDMIDILEIQTMEVEEKIQEINENLIEQNLICKREFNQEI